jgi:hypothetical protein
MAVMELLKPTSGTWRVVTSRWLLYMLATLPGLMALTSHLDETVGKRPWFQDLQPPLDTLSTKLLVPEIADGVALLGAAVVVIWLLQLVWLGGSIQILDPRRSDVRKKVFSHGWQFLARFIRIAVFAAIAVALTQMLLGKTIAGLRAQAEAQNWSVYDAFVTLNLWYVSIGFIVMTLIGLVAFWIRMIVVTEDRRDLRRLPWLAVKILVRRPVSAFLLQFLLICAVLGTQVMALWCWRQSPNDGLWLGVWALLQLLTAYVWQLRIRSAFSALENLN